MNKEIILNSAQLKCLVSPASNDVMACLRALGGASAADVASYLGRAPATAHYHLKALEKVGLVTLVEKRPTRRKPIAVYKVAAESLTLPDASSEPGVLELSIKAVLAGARQAMRGYESAANADRLNHVMKSQVRLTEANAHAFLDLLEEANRFCRDHTISEGGVVIHWSSLAFEEPR